MPILSTILSSIRTELSDAGTFWSDTELNRAVAKTESLLSRAISKKAVREVTITHEVSSETLVIASSTGTTTYKPVEWDTEVLKTAAGVTKVRDTDYTINYMTGVITEIGALLPDAIDYTISYHIDSQRFDLGSLLTNPLKVTRIEYPVGDKPPTYIPTFDLIEDFIIFGKDITLTEDKHLRIYYDAMWTGAGAATGEYPENLADAVIIGASGQALILKAEKYVQASITELLLVNAAADSMATPLADINVALDKVGVDTALAITALAKVALYLETNGTTDNAQDVLANITDDIIQLRTAMKTAHDAANTYLDVVGAATTGDLDLSTYGAIAMLKVPVDSTLINTLTVADAVTQKYVELSRGWVTIASARISAALGFVEEANSRLATLRSYVEEAGGWNRIAEDFIAEVAQRLGAANNYVNEASQRVAEVNAWGVQADRYTVTSREYLNIAGRYLASGQSKILEFYSLIGAKPELQQVRSNLNQPTSY